MFGSLGVPEILFILVLALLIFGPRRLPEIGKTLGKAMGEFRRATTDLKSSIEREVILEKSPPPARKPPARPKAEAKVEAQTEPESVEDASEPVAPKIEESSATPTASPSEDDASPTED